MEATIEVRGLRKRFGPTLALDGMTFTVAPGQVTGFVGPNGAGKSTTMRVILGLDAPDEGTALVGGRRYAALHRPLTHLGSLLDAAALQPSRTGRNHLLWLAHSQGLDAARVDAVIGQAGLDKAARRQAGGYSLGMRQRLGIAAALLGDPPVLMMDEPFNGMDPEGIIWMRGFLRSLAAAGPGGAGVQPPDERTGRHRRPPGDRRPGQGHRRHQHPRPAGGGVRRPGHAAHHGAGPGGRGTSARGSHGHHRRHRGDGVRAGAREGRARARRERGAVLGGVGAPRHAGGGLPGTHPRCGRVPRRGRCGGSGASPGWHTGAAR